MTFHPFRDLPLRLWRLASCLGGRVTLASPHRATVVTPYFHPERLRHADPWARTLLRCDFLERIIFTNHNPQLRLADWIHVRDPRLELRDSPVRRGCGHRWDVALASGAQFVLVIDDDCLLLPSQLRKLFQHLLRFPGVPHGTNGAVAGRHFFHREMEVDQLAEVYAVTRDQVLRYHELAEQLALLDPSARETIERWADDLVISRAGSGRPRIHNFGPLFHCDSWRAAGIATHQHAEFSARRASVAKALGELVP